MSVLREMREDAGWTQAEFAEAAGIDQRTVRRWESSARPKRKVQIVYKQLLSSVIRNASFRADSQAEETDGQDGQPMPISEVIQQRPDALKIDGVLAPLLGKIPADRAFSVLLGGGSGGGKSSMALMLSKALCKHGLVLYASSEERIDTGTIGIRAEQLGITSDDIDVVEVHELQQIDEHLSEGDYLFCVVDSVNELDASPEDIMSLMKIHRDISWVLVAQSNAAEKATLGGARWRHLVDIRLWCEVDKEGRRIVRNVKNRFAPSVGHIDFASKTQKQVRKATNSLSNENQNHDIKENTMTDYNEWIVRRLETDLESARKEVESLRARMEEKLERIRELELKVARHEIEDELSAQEPKPTLADKFDPDSVSQMAEKLTPIAMIVGDILKTFKSVRVPHDPAPASNTAPATPVVTTNPFVYDEAPSSSQASNAWPNIKRHQ